VSTKVSSAFLIVYLFGALSVHAAEPTAKTPIPAFTDTEAKYFKLRDKLCISKEVQQSDYSSLEALKRPTRSIIGTVNVDGFKGEGELTIIPGYDDENPCDYLDGLSFPGDNEFLDVTTASFLVNYLARHSHAPASMEDLYAVSADAGSSEVYMVIPVHKANGQDFIYASLYGSFSDIGPYLPDRISVYVWVGKRRFSFSEEAKEKAPEIPECSKVWKDYVARADKADAIYREATSNGKEIRDKTQDERLSHESARIREQGFAAFRACYRKVASERSLSKAFVEQAQSMVNRIHPE